MISRMSTGAAALVAAIVATDAMAQESSNRVAAETDWSVFEENDPKECWIVSAPKSTENTRNGRVVAVNRGDIRMFVTFRPGSDVEGEVSFQGGYPFADGSTVKVEIGNESFELFTSPQDQTAWPPSPAEDKKLTAAMRAGADAVVTARSGRGTLTKDTFSLMGFTAALEEAEKRCGG